MEGPDLPVLQRIRWNVSPYVQAAVNHVETWIMFLTCSRIDFKSIVEFHGAQA